MGRRRCCLRRGIRKRRIITCTGITSRNKVRQLGFICGCMMCLLPAGAVATRPATNPTAAALDRDIAALIVQLDSPDAKIREKAMARLVNFGPRVIKPLKEAMALDVAPEFGSRAKSVLEEIARQWRYVNDNGGNVVGGFQATLHGKPADFELGKPISLSL